MTAAPSQIAAPEDLRSRLPATEIRRVERSFGVQLDGGSVVRKRRTLGFRTDRDSWVRIEVRAAGKLDGWNGTEATSALEGVAAPRWYQSLTWLGDLPGLMWRADEMELVSTPPVKPGGVLTVDPGLHDSWWRTFNGSLAALRGHATGRTATPHSQPITQQRLTSTIRNVFPAVADTTVTEWATAHGDLNWANLTAPECRILDWEDWGTAPKGLDAAYLWSSSLAVPGLATRIESEQRHELDSRAGALAKLYFCAELVAATAAYSGPLYEPALVHAQTLVSDFARSA